MAAYLFCVGGEDHFLRLPFLRAMTARGFRVSAAGTGDAAPFEQSGIVYHRYQLERFVDPLADWSTIRRLAVLIAQLRPQLIQSFDTKPNILVPFAARRTGLPVIMIRTINGSWVYSSRTALALMLRPVQRNLQRLAARATTATVFQNRDDVELFRRYRLSRGNVNRLIAGSGVDLDTFDCALVDSGLASHNLREELRLGNSPVVITVTRLSRQKGVSTLLHAAALVHAVRPNVRFLIVGSRETEGRQAISREELEEHQPYVIATGARRDVPALLRLADVFAFPTEYREGVPRVLLEAALAEVPIVTTSMPGCTDVVRDAWSGFVVPPRDPQFFARRILELLSSPSTARQLAQNAAARVRRDFGLELVADQYCELYHQLLGDAPDRADRPAQPYRATIRSTNQVLNRS
jgi:glycosyltransferase involved in cell wall biosynthesis